MLLQQLQVGCGHEKQLVLQQHPVSPRLTDPVPSVCSVREGEQGESEGRRAVRYPDAHQLFVGNVPHDVDKAELKEFFERELIEPCTCRTVLFCSNAAETTVKCPDAAQQEVRSKKSLVETFRL